MAAFRAWESPLVTLLWGALLPIALWAIARTARRGRLELAILVGWFGAALALRALATDLPANWYTDYEGPVDAAQPTWARFAGGITAWPRLVSMITPVPPGAIFAVSVLCSAAAVGLLVAALRRCIESGAAWPRHTPAVLGTLLATDAVLVRLGASDAPHDVALLAFALGFFAYAEALASPDGANGAGRWIAIACCAALVGLTRMELWVAPLVYPFIHGTGVAAWRRHLWPSAAAAAGALAALVVALPRGASTHLAHHHPESASALLSGALGQLPWTAILPPLFDGSLGLVSFGLFLLVCWEKRPLFAALVAHVILVAPKVVGGFGQAVIGTTDPSSRYDIVTIPVLLLVYSAAAAQTVEWLAPRLRDASGRLRSSAVRAIGAASFWVAASLALEGHADEPPSTFQVEYVFLRDEIERLPRGATVVTVWLVGVTHWHIDASLALPHPLLSHARPDLRWIVVEPGGALPEGERLYFYQGTTCNLDSEGRATDDDTDRAIVRSHLAVCRVLADRVGTWLASRSEPVRRGTWPVRSGRVDLRLGRL